MLHANKRTSLLHAAYWTAVAWSGWGLMFCTSVTGFANDALDEIRYATLCLTAGVGIAVLGARRPHVAAWGFVVLGFLAVMLSPLVEHRMLGTPLLPGLRAWLLGGSLILTVLMYVPTRFGLAAILVGIGCLDVYLCLEFPDWYPRYRLADYALLGLSLAPWAGFVRPAAHDLSEADELWLDFRDRYGLLWGLRFREQFNSSMLNVGVPVHLSWHGVRGGLCSPRLAEDQSEKVLETLRALRKRFMPDP
jgi:hypothetical protein